MTRAKRLEPVQEVVDDAERRLALSVVGCERRVVEAQNKLQELQRYRDEYEQQFTQRAARGMGAHELLDYRAFMARLNEAMKQQQAVVQRVGGECDVARKRWQEAARRAKALDHVVDRWNAEERQVQERREQRDTDERAQRKTRTEQ